MLSAYSSLNCPEHRGIDKVMFHTLFSSSLASYRRMPQQFFVTLEHTCKKIFHHLRNAELFRSEKTFGGHLVRPTAQRRTNQTRLFRDKHSWVLNISKDVDSIVYLWNLCLTILIGKGNPTPPPNLLISSCNFPYSNVYPLPLFLLPFTSKKSLVLSSL